MPFEKNVFVNCPFDRDFQPLLRAILFCIVRAQHEPRLATERSDSSQNRLTKICGLIKESKFSIHDLSRCQAKKAKEISRLNMPFELGIDLGAQMFGAKPMREKRFLVLDAEPYRLKKAMSDINGWDPKIHDNDAEKALTIVRNWLIQEAGALLPGGKVLYGQFLLFEEWKYERTDHTREDIDSFEDFELIAAMKEWVQAQQGPA